ncbi:MAG: PleD family two-component system response regulator [Oligoflexales bacterium]
MNQKEETSYIGKVLDELKSIQHDFQELTREIHSPNSKILLGRLYNRFIFIQKNLLELSKAPDLANEVAKTHINMENNKKIALPKNEPKPQDAVQTEIDTLINKKPKLEQKITQEERSLLVIDDDETTHLIVKAAFKKHGIKVHGITDPSTAMQDLLRLNPSFVILDILMPQVNGFEVLSKIRSQDRFSDIIIIVGSSRSYDKDRIAAIELGADEFIAKPYQLNELVNKVKSLYEIKFGKTKFSA